MNSNEKENKELQSLNTELAQFYLEELEERLETDPLAIGGLIDLMAEISDNSLIRCKQLSCNDKFCIIDFG